MTPEESLKKMKEASRQFYLQAVRTECHAFIEFTGLMNEYIKICEEFQRQYPDQDFRKCNIHNSQRLEFKPYHIAYFNEKLQCIYQARIQVKTTEDQ